MSFAPCPLCGHAADLKVDLPSKGKTVLCTKCGCSLSDKDVDRLKSRWDKRAIKFKGGVLHVRPHKSGSVVFLFKGQGNIVLEDVKLDREFNLSWVE